MPEDLKLRFKALPPKQQRKVLALLQAVSTRKMHLRAEREVVIEQGEGKVNTKQKTTLLIMVLINTAMGMFPPWHIKYNGRLINQGYALLVYPPHKSAVITLSTLAVQVLIVTFASLALIYYFKTPKQTPMELDVHARETISALFNGDEEAAIASFKAALGHTPKPKREP